MEWMDEPNREEFEHAGYKCLILRHPELLHLCGYIAVPSGHPCYGKDTSHLPYRDLLEIDVHGGVTWAAEGDGDHRPAGLWWLGFDCGHFMDSVPYIEALATWLSEMSLGGSYRNFQYVRQQTMSLADQVAKLEFIDWQFAWVWPLFLPLKTALWIWRKKRGKGE